MASTSTATATTATTTTTAPTVTPPSSVPAPTASAVEQLTLSTVELQLLSEIDSQQFGFLKLNDDNNIRKRSIITKAIKYLERFIVRARERQRKAQVLHLQQARGHFLKSWKLSLLQSAKPLRSFFLQKSLTSVYGIIRKNLSSVSTSCVRKN